jgi:hypothetical protein
MSEDNKGDGGGRQELRSESRMTAADKRWQRGMR